METFVSHVNFLKKTALKLRIDLLQMLNQAQSGHLGGCLSVMEILTALYYGKISDGTILNFDPKKPGSEDQDYFILSKGHAAPALYTVLADNGFFSRNELKHYRKINSLLQAYPYHKIPGITVSSGAPAYGFTAAVGLAMALKMDRAPNRVFCLIGDGELQSGELWEAALVASKYKLDNLIVIVDWNYLQMDGTVRSVLEVEPISDKFETFGWKAIPVSNGHDFEDLLIAFEKAHEIQRRPVVMVARTVKGKGVAFAENKPFYHAEVLSDEEMMEAVPRLERELEVLEETT